MTTTVRLIGQIALPAGTNVGDVPIWNGTAYVPGAGGTGSGTVKTINLLTPDGAGNVQIDKATVGLGSVNNTADSAKPISTAQQAALDLKAPLASPAFTGTPTGITKAHVGLGNVDNTSDASKPVSTAQQAALDAKAPLASPAFTGTPTGITKAHVGLGNVDNTSDANKPVSTAQQAALDAKAALSHTHPSSQISDATTVGKAVLTAADAAAARTAIGAGTGTYSKLAGGIPSTDLTAAAQTSLGKADTAVQQTEQLRYLRRYSSGAWQTRGTIPDGSEVEWSGPVSVGPPPAGGNYAVAGLDTYVGKAG